MHDREQLQSCVGRACSLSCSTGPFERRDHAVDPSIRPRRTHMRGLEGWPVSWGRQFARNLPRNSRVLPVTSKNELPWAGPCADPDSRQGGGVEQTRTPKNAKKEGLNRVSQHSIQTRNRGSEDKWQPAVHGASCETRGPACDIYSRWTFHSWKWDRSEKGLSKTWLPPKSA